MEEGEWKETAQNKDYWLRRFLLELKFLSPGGLTSVFSLPMSLQLVESTVPPLS
jgi:hypothetical protein